MPEAPLAANERTGECEFETHAAWMTSGWATLLVMVTLGVGGGLSVGVHAALPRALALAADVFLVVGAGSILVAGFQALRPTLRVVRVYQDRVVGLSGPALGITFQEVEGWRVTVERYGIGPWNSERVLWLKLHADELRIGREWTQHKELQDRILQRLTGVTEVGH